MAGTWRVSVEAIEGLRGFRHAGGKSQEEDGPDEPISRMLIIELSDGRASQRTKPFEVPEDGNVRVNRVLFVPAPVAGRHLVVRAIRPYMKDQDGVIGEGTLPKRFGRFQVELTRRERQRGIVHLSVMEGLPSPASAAEAQPTLAVPVAQPNGQALSPSARGRLVPQSAAAHVPAVPSSPMAAVAVTPTPVSKSPIALGRPVVVGESPVMSPVASSPANLSTPIARPVTVGESPIKSSPAKLSTPSARPAVVGEPPIVSSPAAVPSQVLSSPGAAPSQALSPPSAAPSQIPSPSYDPLSSTAFQTTRGSGQRPGARFLAPGPPIAAVVRPLRMRPPGLPFVGNCDVTIEGVQFPPSFQQPFLIIGLEGQEFLAEDVGQCLKYMFPVGAVQSSVTIYCYDASQTQYSPLGRILVPLSDVLWPVGEMPSFRRIKAGFEKDMRPFQKQYTLQFMPASEFGDSHCNPMFVDTFEPGLTEAVKSGPAQFGAFGELSLSIEVTFRSEVHSLVGFYLASIMAGAQGFGNVNGDVELPVLANVQEELSAMSVLDSPSLRSVLTHLTRLKHYTNKPSTGFLRFLREQPHHGYIAAGCWFVLCMVGLFPCSLWVLPIYIWLGILGNGFLIASQRQADWACSGQEAKDLFWQEVAEDGKASDDPSGKVRGALMRFSAQLREVEPFVRLAVLSLERVSNALTFADGPASVACFLALTAVLGALSVSFFLITHLDGLYFASGVYGALVLLTLARPVQPLQPSHRGGPGGPRSFQCAFNQAFACVPDQAELAHRFVATRVQPLDV